MRRTIAGDVLVNGGNIWGYEEYKEYTAGAEYNGKVGGGGGRVILPPAISLLNAGNH